MRSDTVDLKEQGHLVPWFYRIAPHGMHNRGGEAPLLLDL